jgi:hypothetical protein
MSSCAAASNERTSQGVILMFRSAASVTGMGAIGVPREDDHPAGSQQVPRSHLEPNEPECQSLLWSQRGAASGLIPFKGRRPGPDNPMQRSPDEFEFPQPLCLGCWEPHNPIGPQEFRKFCTGYGIASGTGVAITLTGWVSYFLWL